VFLQNLTIENLRIISRLELAFTAGPRVVWGANGQGKSSLLEGIFLACTGLLWRANREEEAICWGQEITRVKAQVVDAKGDATHTEIALARNGKPLLKINGVVRRRGELIGLVPIIGFCSDDIEIVKGEPSLRRQFLNREIGQINSSYRWNLLHYNRALEQRNRLLKEVREGRGDRSALPTWEEALAKYGGRLLEEREKFLISLAKTSGDYLARFHAGSLPLQLLYHPAVSLADPEQARQQIEGKAQQELSEVLLEGFKRSREEELARGYSLVGPQRDDFDIVVAQVDQRTFGSRGQQRSVAVALRLGLTKMVLEASGEQPILLLDDVFSELDYKRRQGLLEALSDQQQFFLTTTDLQEIPADLLNKAQVQQINDGRIVAEI